MCGTCVDINLMIEAALQKFREDLCLQKSKLKLLKLYLIS